MREARDKCNLSLAPCKYRTPITALLSRPTPLEAEGAATSAGWNSSWALRF